MRQLRPAEREQLSETLDYLADLLKVCGVVDLRINQAGLSWRADGPADAHALATLAALVAHAWVAGEHRKRRNVPKNHL